MSKDYIELLQDENTGEFYEPYATIVCRTEEDFKNMQEALEKQMPMKVRIKEYRIAYPDYYCPICHKQQKETRKNRTKGCYCERCGQKLTWKGEAE